MVRLDEQPGRLHVSIFVPEYAVSDEILTGLTIGRTKSNGPVTASSASRPWRRAERRRQGDGHIIQNHIISVAKTSVSAEPKLPLKRGNRGAVPDAATSALDDTTEGESNESSEESPTGSAELVMAEILRGLHDGRYVPGQKLTETELTRKYGVGRGSVREALRKLDSKGLVTVSRHHGASIRIFNRDGVRDVLEVYEHIACLAAALAAKRLGDPKDADRLRSILAEMAEQLKRGETFETVQLRYRFLAEVSTLSKNQELRQLMPQGHVSVLRAQFRNVFDLRFAQEDLERLKLVVDSILSRDPGEAEHAMREYTQRFGIAIQQSPDSYFAH